jgi:hypothetical protein
VIDLLVEEGPHLAFGKRRALDAHGNECTARLR